MDLINKSLINTLHFVSSVQDSCDRHRICLEQRWHQEYTMYLTEWKLNQIEIKKQADIRKCEDTSNKDDAEDLEELALADSLLRKARNIRSKNQKLINGIVDFMNIPFPNLDSGVMNAKAPNINKTSEKSKINRKLPHSKSDFIAACHKNIVVPRSKSATVPFVPKDDHRFHSNRKCSSATTKCVASNHIKSMDKVSDSLSVISNKDLDVLKRLHANLPSCHEVKRNKSPVFSDSSGDIHQHQTTVQPTSRAFLSLMKERLDSTHSSHLKLKLWYPFLSCKNEMFLTTVKCNTVCSLKKVYSILHSIQETMMWIDLLYLIENDVCPNLILEEKDLSMLRVWSYLLSIFHPTSQRIPILDPNG